MRGVWGTVIGLIAVALSLIVACVYLVHRILGGVK